MPTTQDGVVFSCQLISSPIYCYAPKQIQAAYGFNQLYSRGLTGKGRTIVIVDAFSDPYIASDLATFDSTFGIAAPPAFNIIYPDGPGPYDAGWSDEITLDVEWAHAIAPAATIDLVLAKDNIDADLNSATKYAVDNNLGDVISQSFGEAESCASPSDVQTLHNIYQEADGKHMTLLASSGDEGAAQVNCEGTAYIRSASWPADDPLVTGVGATSLTANLTTGAYGSERAWADDYSGNPYACYPASQFGCSGGGFSNIFTRPGYQASTPGTNWAHRGVPDVAYNGGVNGGVLGYFDGIWYIFGGTSAGSPQWAGLVALTDQLYRGRIGSLNTTLYRIAASPSLYRTAFHDITSGNNNFPNVDATTIFGYRTANGWDPVTGLGTPKANVLVPLLVS